MFEIGKYNKLEIVKAVDFGIYLDGGSFGEILMPTRYLPETWQQGDIIDVFIYRDSEDRLLATTEIPFIIVGEFACLTVTAVTEIGAFLDWGLPKDLLVPFREQKHKMVRGKSYVVYAYLDEKTLRIVASSKVDKFLNKTVAEYLPEQEVDLIICDQTDLGYNVIINKSHRGLIYQNEIFQTLQTGQQLKGFVKAIREDGKIDISLQQSGYKKKINNIEELIISTIKENDGKTAISEKSSPAIIYSMFGISKKTFKMAIGALYKKHIIDFHDNGTIFMK